MTPINLAFDETKLKKKRMESSEEDEPMRKICKKRKKKSIEFDSDDDQSVYEPIGTIEKCDNLSDSEEEQPYSNESKSDVNEDMMEKDDESEQNDDDDEDDESEEDDEDDERDRNSEKLSLRIRQATVTTPPSKYSRM